MPTEKPHFMNGMNFDDGKVVATDGRRMYVSPGFDDFPSIILPITKALTFILKKAEIIEYGIWKRAPEIINGIEHFYPDTYSIFNFLYKDCEFHYCIQNIDGQFPNWKRIVELSDLSNVTGVPCFAEWKEIYNSAKNLYKSKKDARILIKPNATDSNFVDVSYQPIQGSEEIFIDSMIWPSFGKEKFDQAALAINSFYLDGALSLDGIREICFGSLNRAITFKAIDGAFVIVMPMQID